LCIELPCDIGLDGSNPRDSDLDQAAPVNTALRYDRAVDPLKGLGVEHASTFLRPWGVKAS
jgi:hypothetical protein